MTKDQIEEDLEWLDYEGGCSEFNKFKEIAACIRELQAELERERIRLAACGVVAMADTPDSAAKARNMHPDYYSASCGDVERRVDECISLRQKCSDLQAELDKIKGSETLGTLFEYTHENGKKCLSHVRSQYPHTEIELIRRPE